MFGICDTNVHIQPTQSVRHKIRFRRKYEMLVYHHTKEQLLGEALNLLHY